MRIQNCRYEQRKFSPGYLKYKDCGFVIKTSVTITQD